MDSGASSHITNNTSNLEQNTHPYGKDEILVGNGDKLQVCHSSVASLPCKNQNLKLNQVLHAPKVAKNLINVSQLTCDNNVLVEFDSSGCYVKDKITGEILLKG